MSKNFLRRRERFFCNFFDFKEFTQLFDRKYLVKKKREIVEVEQDYIAEYIKNNRGGMNWELLSITAMIPKKEVDAGKTVIEEQENTIWKRLAEEGSDGFLKLTLVLKEYL